MLTPNIPSTTARQHNFATIPTAGIPRSAFNRSRGVKTVFDAAYLIPILCDEALPGDTISLTTELVARLSTLSAPIMDNVYIDVFYFAVPNRLLWENWERFCGAQDDPTDSIDFTIPIVTCPVGGYADDSIYDYMGIPPGIDNQDISAFWCRAYNMIWNEWFRSENLQNSVTENIDNGPDTDTDYTLLKRGKRHDYFTSCLPWPQKGDPVELPLGISAPVVGTGTNIPLFELNSTTGFALASQASGADAVWNAAPGGATSAQWDVTSLEADLTAATAATINTIREAFQFQVFLERDARGGTRYVESIRSHFGVTSPDFRMQRPEFLGGGTFPVIVKTVEGTNQASAIDLGDLGAYGIAIGRKRGFIKSFTEHCTIIGLAMGRADLHYQQGTPRQFLRRTRFEFYWPEFAHLGEQVVTNQELYADGTNDADPFGYQERWAEYRYGISHVTAAMRSSHPTSLDIWHLSQEFGSLPTLGATFIEEAPPLARVLKTGVLAPQFIMDCFFHINHVRPMPTYSIPGWTDHF